MAQFVELDARPDARGVSLADNPDAPVTTVGRLRLDRDLDILAEPGQQPHQAVAREIGEPSIEQSRHFGLIDAEQRRSGDLGQAPPFDDLSNQDGKLRFGQLFLGRGKAQIGE